MIVEGTTTMRMLLAAQSRNAAVPVHEFVLPLAGGTARAAAPFDLLLGVAQDQAGVPAAQPRLDDSSRDAGLLRTALSQDEGGPLGH